MSQDLITLIQTRLAEVSVAHAATDFHVALSIDGDRTYFFGPTRCPDQNSGDDAIFEMSCIVKPLMAATALQLANRDELDLQLPIAHFIPELSETVLGKLANVRHLIAHTVGHKGFLYFPPIVAISKERTAALSRLRGAEQLFWPGSVFNYENSSTAILGLILSASNGSPFRDLLCDEVLSPLGISLSRNFSRDSSRGQPSTVLPLTILQFIALVEAMMTRSCGALAHRNPLSEGTILALREESIPIPRAPNSVAQKVLPIRYCAGLAGFSNGFFGYEGISKTQAVGFRFLPERRFAAAVAVSRPNRQLRRALLGAIVDSVVGAGDDLNSRADSKPVGVERDEIEGHYVGIHAWDLEIRLIGKAVELLIRNNTRSLLRRRCHFNPNGSLVFAESQGDLYDGTFFRYSRTNELCLMFGMHALKKVPLVRTAGPEA